MSDFDKMGQQIEGELEWNAELTSDGNEFVDLPEGDYNFTVTKFDRERYPGGAKIGPCPKAKLYLQIETSQGNAIIFHNLMLHSKCMGLISSFFIAIGQKKHGEPVKMDWDKVIGSTGRCKIAKREYDGKTYNEVKKFYDPEESASAPTGFVPGKF